LHEDARVLALSNDSNVILKLELAVSFIVGWGVQVLWFVVRITSTLIDDDGYRDKWAESSKVY